MDCLNISAMQAMMRTPGNWSQGILLRDVKPDAVPLRVVPFEKYPDCVYSAELVEWIRKSGAVELADFGYDVPLPCQALGRDTLPAPSAA